jgi:hypothetical protein
MNELLLLKKAVHAASWVNSLPCSISARISLCAKERDIPLELAGLVTLSAIATSLGKGLQVKSGRNRTTRGNLYIVAGVASGIGKSAIFEDLMGPIIEFENNLQKWWEEEATTRAKAGEELLKTKITAIRGGIRRMALPSFKIFALLQETELKRNVCRRYADSPVLLADDATPEALAELMVRSGESVSTVSADARYILKRLTVQNSRDESFYLKSFSGDISISSRITRKGSRLRTPCLTALLLSQRDAYASFISKSIANRAGLLPRILHRELMPSKSDPPQIDLRTASTIRNKYSELIRELIETYRFETEPALVDPKPNALRLLNSIESDSRKSVKDDETIMGEVKRRKAEQTWRVALCLHAARHGSFSHHEQLSLEDAEAALAIVKSLTRLPV